MDKCITHSDFAQISCVYEKNPQCIILVRSFADCRVPRGSLETVRNSKMISRMAMEHATLLQSSPDKYEYQFYERDANETTPSTQNRTLEIDVVNLNADYIVP